MWAAAPTAAHMIAPRIARGGIPCSETVTSRSGANEGPTSRCYVRRGPLIADARKGCRRRLVPIRFRVRRRRFLSRRLLHRVVDILIKILSFEPWQVRLGLLPVPFERLAHVGLFVTA